jgi:hypothetical protein
METPILATSQHQPQCASCRDITIGDIFVKGIEFLEEGGGQEQFVEK